MTVRRPCAGHCADQPRGSVFGPVGRGLIPRSDSPGLGVGIPIMVRNADDFRIANREATPGTVVSLQLSLR